MKKGRFLYNNLLNHSKIGNKYRRDKLAGTYSYTNSKGQTYYLHTREVTLKNGRIQRIYFFALDIRDGAICSKHNARIFRGN